MQAAGSTVAGVVKSYHGLKGYGFITSEEVEGDIFFTRNELPADVREVGGKFLEGRPVQFEGTQGPDGRAKATTVLLPPADGLSFPGQIKSYSERNGYGFITSSSLADDVRFQQADVPPLMPGTNLVGQLVTFDALQLADGKLRVTALSFQSSPMGKGKGDFAAAMAKGAWAGLVPTMKGKGAPPGTSGPPNLLWMGVEGKGKWGPSMGKGSVMDLDGPQTGQVKSYSEKNGYGFIVCSGAGGDIKFGRADLEWGTIEPGATVDFFAMTTPDGRTQAKQVRPSEGVGTKRPSAAPSQSAYLGPPLAFAGAFAPAKRPRASPTPSASPMVATGNGEPTLGVVKSYNPVKGLGFITSPGLTSDVAFFSKEIPEEVHPLLQAGSEVSFDIMQMPDGKLRAQGLRLRETLE